MDVKYNPFRNELVISGDGISLKQNKIGIPASLRGKLIKLVHIDHQGIEKTKIQNKEWFPNLNRTFMRTFPVYLRQHRTNVF